MFNEFFRDVACFDFDAFADRQNLRVLLLFDRLFCSFLLVGDGIIHWIASRSRGARVNFYFTKITSAMCVQTLFKKWRS